MVLQFENGVLDTVLQNFEANYSMEIRQMMGKEEDWDGHVFYRNGQRTRVVNVLEYQWSTYIDDDPWRMQALNAYSISDSVSYLWVENNGAKLFDDYICVLNFPFEGINCFKRNRLMKKILALFCILSFYGACAQIMKPQVYLGVSSGSIGDDRRVESAFALTGACLAVRASNSIQFKTGLEFASYFNQERRIRQHSFQPYLDLWWKSDSVSKWSVFLGYGVNYYSLKIHNLEDNGVRLNELKSNWSLGMARMGVGFAFNKNSSLWLRGSMRQKDNRQSMLEKYTWSIEAGYAYSFKSKQWKSPNIKPRTFSHYLSFAMGSQAIYVLGNAGKRENRFQSYYGIRLKLASHLAFIAEARILYIDNYDNGGKNIVSGNGGAELSLPLMSFGNLNLRGLAGIAQNRSQIFRTKAVEMGCLTKFRMEFFAAYSIAKHPTFSDSSGSLDYIPVYKTIYGGIRYYLNRVLSSP